MTVLDSVSPQGVTALEEVRREQARRIVWLFAVFVVLPTLGAWAYYGLVASPTFTSVATFSVDTADGGPPGPNLPAPGTDLARDALIVRDYLRSRDALRELVDRHDFRATYQASSIDRFSRLPDDASFEAAYDYYLDHVYVDLSAETGFLELAVTGYASRDAERLASAIVAAAEAKVRTINEALADGTPRHLVRINGPTAPDRASGPIVWREVLTWAFGTIALLVIGWILVATAREHAI